MPLQSIKYSKGHLEILDQLLLPNKAEYIAINNCDDGWNAIKHMNVRGAPAIAIVGSLSLAIELEKTEFTSVTQLFTHIGQKLKLLVTARPTAVNMVEAANSLLTFAEGYLTSDVQDVKQVKTSIISHIEEMLEKDLSDNHNIGKHFVNHILQQIDDEKISVLTHCNTGSLATSGYGTALGAVRSLHQEGKLECCYFTETRPYNQGSRLTAYECITDSLPHQMICDSMAGALMTSRKISAVLVGADRVVANGDTANKIGTFQLAVLAKHHAIPFYVCAPKTSIDFDSKDGSSIVIEERPHSEMISINGVPIAPEGVKCWNPAFDVTPSNLITGGIVTELGVFSPERLCDLQAM